MLPPRGVSTAHRTRTNFVTAGNLPNVTPNQLISNCDFGEGLKLHVLTVLTLAYYGGRHNTALGPAGLPVI